MPLERDMSAIEIEASRCGRGSFRVTRSRDDVKLVYPEPYFRRNPLRLQIMVLTKPRKLFFSLLTVMKAVMMRTVNFPKLV